METINISGNNDEDPCTSLVSIVRNFGYPVEVFEDVQTEDNYLLNMFRIPHGKTNKSNTPKPVVLIMHGLMSSCADYLILGPDRSLPYLLAERGYDVWLGNPRGSIFSLKHKDLNPNLNEDYWKFSYHEIGIFDYPAMISKIRETTGCEAISCIATSQGTTSFFVLFSEKPYYSNLIKVLICMAPIHTVQNLPGTFTRVVARYPIVWRSIIKAFGWTSFPPAPLKTLFRYLASFTHYPGPIRNIVIHMMFIINGYNYDQLNVDELPAILKYIPNPTSVHHFEHFAQSLSTGEFKNYDYGPEENLSRYGQVTPPFYDMNKTTCPVALFYSKGGDNICSPLDVKDIKQKLPNVVVDHPIEDPKFSHMDFVFAKDVVDLLYKYFYPILEKYST